MTRTLHFIDGLGPGGAERSLAELLPDLGAYGIEPHVVVLRHAEGENEHHVRQAGIPVHYLDGIHRSSRVRSLRQLIRRTQPDLLHTTLFEADVIGRLAALGTPTPVLTSLVNTSYESVRLLDPKVRRSRLRAAQAVDAATAMLGTNHFHAITEAVRQSAIQRLRLNPKRITVVPRGRRRSRLGEPGMGRRQRVRSEIGIPTDAIMLLHVGREEFQKGHTVLLQALGPMISSQPGLVLVMAGRSGNASAEVDRQVASMPAAPIIRLGHSENVPDLLAAADLFIFPSHYEGLGGAALEAMALEVPMVVSDLPALRELLDGVARFFDNSSASSPTLLRRAVEVALSNPIEARSRARSGRTRFDQFYEQDLITEKMAALFLNCAS